MPKKLLLALFTFIFLFKINAQTGKISGTILDSKTGETLPGATALIDGTTKGASADFDGKFILTGIPVGKVTIVINYISYNSKKITDIEVKSGEVTDINVLLEPSTSQDLQEVEVVVTLNKENNTALVLQQKNNASVSDGVSSEAIKKTPDRNTSDVIKRISGATIQDNKFAIIRGMNDRYNTAYLNGAPLPSSESDRKAFSFDIFPANLLDNIVILKTATPDLPGDFAGGIIQINTKTIPEKNYYSFSLSGGFNTQTTFKEFKTYERGKTDWLGIDDGKRALPANLPSTKEYNLTDNLQKIEYAKSFNYDWALKNRIAAPNLGLQFAMANVGKVFKRDAGSVFSITYNNTNTTLFANRREFEEQGDSVQKTRDYTDTSFTNNILASIMWNLSYKITPNNQIGFKNLVSVNTDDRVVVRKGIFDANTPTFEKSNVRWFTENKIYSGQLNGDHYIEKLKIKIKWVGGYSDIKRDIPNLRKIVYQKSSALESDSVKYSAVLFESTVYPNSAGSMFFATNRENIKSASLDIGKAFKVLSSKHEFKLGGFYQFRDREFKSRLIGYTQYRKGSQIRFNDSLAYLNEANIFNPQNMGTVDGPGNYDGGFKLSEATTNIDSYGASSELFAGYLMLDSRFFDKLRFIYGVRAESYRQEIRIFNLLNELEKKDTTFLDFLPSVNAVYSLTEKINIRAAYYKTVCRPEFRELASFNFYDFITDFSVSGNPALIRSLIDNFDLRFEWFPGAGQLISVSAFYKDIRNPIEQVSNTASAIRSLLYTNGKKATNIGAELEYRFKLSTIFNNDSIKWLSNTTLYTNLAYINSKVDVGGALIAGEDGIRPLQGQSPFIVNAGLQYLDYEKGWSTSISYNVVGRRILIVGSNDEPTYWENPRHVLDFQIVKTFKERLEIKLNVRDILAQNLIFYQDLNKNGKLDKNSESENKNKNHNKNVDNVMINSNLAPTINVSISYKF
jgi:TonB-dependent receptor